MGTASLAGFGGLIGFYYPPIFLAGAESWRAGAGSRFGEADRMRRDRRERPRRGARERDNGPLRKMASRRPGYLA